jgi:flavorubredoxin
MADRVAPVIGRPTPIDLPRELAPGLFWLGECRVNPAGHAYNSVYVVNGDDCSAFVDGGIPSSSRLIMEQIETLHRQGRLAEPRYAFVTHSELAHAGFLGHLLARFPDVAVHGDVSDLHLVFPEHADRFYFADPGDRFDLGGTELVTVEAVFRDYAHSRWFFDTKRHALFGGDGFSYNHLHEDGACGHLAEEAPTLDIGAGMAVFAEAAFHWTAFVDVEPYIRRLEELIFDELDAKLLAPAHGLPIGNPAATMPQIRAGLREIRQL